MKIKIALLFFLLLGLHLKAQVISFNDSTFKSILLQSSSNNFIAQNSNGDYFAIDSNNNNEIEVDEAAQVAYLEIGSASITSLNGISYFVNLIALRCENNQLTNLDVSNLLFLNFLDCSNNQLNFLNVNGLTELNLLYCQFNNLTSLNLSSMVNATAVDCSYNNISTLNVSNLSALVTLNCSNNAIALLDLSDLVSLTTLDCSYNVLANINTTSLVSLNVLNFSFNQVAAANITNLNFLASVACNNNNLLTLNLVNLPSLNNLVCDYNALPVLAITNLLALKTLSCSHNNLIELNLNGLSQLETVNCQNNQIVSIEYSVLTALTSFNCNNNQISQLDLNGLSNLKYLYCNQNQLNSLSLQGLTTLQVLSCTQNHLATLDFSDTQSLQTLYCSNNLITSLDLQTAFNLQSLFCENNNLLELLIKNGAAENFLQLQGNASLNYICADESDMELVQNEITNNGYNCVVNSYCSFNPGGITFTVQSTSRYDSNTNGCSANDPLFPNVKLIVDNGSTPANSIINNAAFHSFQLNSGSYTLTPVLENPSYFSISPSNSSVDFPTNTSPFTTDFCITPNGNHTDLEIVVLPLTEANSNQNATYSVLVKNKGTTPQNATVTLNFDPARSTFVSGNPAPNFQNSTTLSWIFDNLQPQTATTVDLEFTINSTTINNQVINYTATVTGGTPDETPSDNTSSLNQKIVDTNLNQAKTCIEGESVSTAIVGNYVHYIIRFTNTESASVQNCVVEDVLDASKFDLTSIIPLSSSHPFTTQQTENKLLFIFENINLATTSPDNKGYIAFKIKTLPTLTNGDQFSNEATIWFDYKQPVNSNLETTMIEELHQNYFNGTNSVFYVYPSPTKSKLTIYSVTDEKIEIVTLYNALGQIISTYYNPGKSIDVAALQSGVYWLKATTQTQTNTVQFLKE